MNKKWMGLVAATCLSMGLVLAPPVGAQAPCTWEIGVMGALSGDYAYYGTPLYFGIDLAIDEANDSGDLACTIDNFTQDSQGDPNQAPPLAKQLVARDEVIACLCGFFSGETLASGGIFSEGGLLMVSAGTNPVNARQGFTTYFRAVANDKDQARALARFMRHRFDPRRVVLVTDQQQFGITAMRAARRVLDWRVQEILKIDQERSMDFSEAIARIDKVKADLVMYLGYSSEAAPFVVQLRKELGNDIPFATNGSVDDDKNFGRFVRRNWGERPLRAFGSCACNRPARIPAASDFVDAYRARFERDPKLLAGDMYDAANLVIDFLRTRSGTEDLSELRAAIVDHFESLERAPGVIKRYTWKDNGELRTSARHTFIYKWRNDAWRMKGSLYDTLN